MPNGSSGSLTPALARQCRCRTRRSEPRSRGRPCENIFSGLRPARSGWATSATARRCGLYPRAARSGQRAEPAEGVGIRGGSDINRSHCNSCVFGGTQATPDRAQKHAADPAQSYPLSPRVISSPAPAWTTSTYWTRGRTSSKPR
jgi:hypothetical protein